MLLALVVVGLSLSARRTRQNTTPADDTARLRLAEGLVARGRLDGALALLHAVPERAPAWVPARLAIARIALLRHDAPAAERALVAAAERDPSAITPRHLLVQLLSLQQRSAEARERLWELYRTTNDPQILADLVLSLETAEDVRGLSADLETYVRATPKDPFLSRAWGLSLLLQGRMTEAQPYLERAAQSLDQDPVGRFALAECSLARGDRIDAATALGTRPEDPSETSRWWLLRSRLELAQSGSETARRSLEEAVAANPANREAHFRLGQVLARLGEREEAQRHLGQAELLRGREAELRREHNRIKHVALTPEAAERLGLLCRAAGLIAEARAWFQQAIRLEPTRSSAQMALARLPTKTPAVPFPFSRPSLASSSPGHSAASSPTLSSQQVAVQLVDEAVPAGLIYQYESHARGDLFIADTMGGGVLLLDYDADGWLDVYFVNGRPLPYDPKTQPGTNRLFRNRGDGTFEDVTAKAGVAGLGYGMGGTIGDYDSDGFDDLFVTGLDRTVLYRNRGDGTFEDVTESSGAFSSRWTTAAGFGDLDGDGDLDLVVVTYVECSPAEVFACPDQVGKPIHCSPARFPAQLDHLFRNNGDGTFTEISRESGIEMPNGRGLGLAIADLDEDGRLDLFVANDASANRLYRNLGGLRFEEVGESAGVAFDGSGRATASMGVIAEDLDGDGRIDLLHTNFINESCTLHRNLGGGLFLDTTLAAGLDAPTRPKTGFGAVAIDLENNGRLDLFFANGAVDERPWANSPMAQTAQLFLGGDGGRFHLAGADPSSYFARPVVGRGAAAGDLDNDGRLDVIAVHRDVPVALLHNRAEGGNWLGVRLIGTQSSRTPIGARVRIRAGGRAAVRWLTSGTSYLAASDARLGFGLGAARRIEEIEVRWPSGAVERWTDLPANRVYNLREGSASVGL
jgi:thioredoxin-like negative regulator of GroEL